MTEKILLIAALGLFLGGWVASLIAHTSSTRAVLVIGIGTVAATIIMGVAGFLERDEEIGKIVKIISLLLGVFAVAPIAVHLWVPEFHVNVMAVFASVDALGALYSASLISYR